MLVTEMVNQCEEEKPSEVIDVFLKKIQLRKVKEMPNAQSVALFTAAVYFLWGDMDSEKMQRVFQRLTIDFPSLESFVNDIDNFDFGSTPSHSEDDIPPSQVELPHQAALEKMIEENPDRMCSDAEMPALRKVMLKLAPRTALEMIQCQVCVPRSVHQENSLHTARIDHSKGHCLNNVWPCCGSCNSRQGQKTAREFAPTALENRLYRLEQQKDSLITENVLDAISNLNQQLRDLSCKVEGISPQNTSPSQTNFPPDDTGDEKIESKSRLVESILSRKNQTPHDREYLFSPTDWPWKPGAYLSFEQQSFLLQRFERFVLDPRKWNPNDLSSPLAEVYEDFKAFISSPRPVDLKTGKPFRLTLKVYELIERQHNPGLVDEVKALALGQAKRPEWVLDMEELARQTLKAKSSGAKASATSSDMLTLEVPGLSPNEADKMLGLTSPPPRIPRPKGSVNKEEKDRRVQQSSRSKLASRLLEAHNPSGSSAVFGKK